MKYILIKTALVLFQVNRHVEGQQTLLPLCGNPQCWCDVNAPSSTATECPDYPTGSIYTDKPEVADFYASLTLKNPNYIDLQLCSPDLSESVNLEGTSVDPNILCEEGILLYEGKASKSGKASKTNGLKSNSSLECLPPCSLRDHGTDPVCGIEFTRDGRKIMPDEYDASCSSEKIADGYRVKTFRDDDARVKKGYFLLHQGACGVCSTAKDMASFMRNSFPDFMNPTPTIDTMSFLCQKFVVSSNPLITPKELVDQVSMCLQYGIPNIVPSADLSETCAYAWAINVFLTGLPENDGGCNDVCTLMLNLILNNQCIPNIELKCPYDPVDCALQECLQCDDSVSGAQFIELAGMTRRNAGLHTLLPRPCGSLADVHHMCVASL